MGGKNKGSKLSESRKGGKREEEGEKGNKNWNRKRRLENRGMDKHGRKKEEREKKEAQKRKNLKSNFKQGKRKNKV